MRVTVYHSTSSTYSHPSMATGRQVGYNGQIILFMSCQFTITIYDQTFDLYHNYVNVFPVDVSRLLFIYSDRLHARVILPHVQLLISAHAQL